MSPLAVMAQAQALDAQRGTKGVLHGVPVAVKDVLAVAGVRCTCGSVARLRVPLVLAR